MKESTTMKKSIMDIFASIGKRIEGPVFVKEFEDSSELIGELESIATAIKDASVQEDIAMDVGFIKAGDQGEKNVFYELKNSFIPMLVLHNVVVQYDDYKAQMDFIIITNKFICILETKKLNGNININTDGDFVRSITNRQGKVYKKEGMYSPISQNQRHVRILENLLLKEKIIKKTPVLSLVVIANPKSIIDFKFAKKEIKEQIVKYDQLTPRIKKMLEIKTDVNLVPTVMTKIADFLIESHVEAENAWITKYRKLLPVETVNLKNEPTTAAEDKPVATSNIADEIAVTISDLVTTPVQVPVQEFQAIVETAHVFEAGGQDLKCAKREALMKFRLDQSRAENIKAYFIFNNNQMEELLEKMPKSNEDLMKCQGFTTVKVEKYGMEILRILAN